MSVADHSVPSSRATAVRRPFAVVLTALTLLLALTSAVVAGPATPSASRPVSSEIEESPTGFYVVLLEDAPLSRYEGGLPGLAGTANSVTGAVKLDTESAASLAYRTYLRTEQDKVLTAIRAIKSDAVVYDGYRLDVALNGFLVKLDSVDQAIAVSQLEGVTSVHADRHYDLLTDVGPEWIDAPSIWGVPDAESMDGACSEGPGGSTSCGEGIVVGIIDTGTNTNHPSFADVGGDGYDHTNPRGEFYGLCNTETGVPYCNDKLIGVYDMTEGCQADPTDLLACNPEDDNGHGSHTASTTAGNVLDAEITSPTLALTRTISGVAPHANIISYKGCQTTAPTGCEITLGVVLSALLASIDQAVDDEVDVINFSIGGGASDPWTDPTSQAFLNANEAGVFASVSAGNDGPGPQTVGHPANSPWVMSVGASTHNREFTNGVINMLSTEEGGPAAPENMFGKSFSCGYPQDPPMTNYAEECDATTAAPEGTAPIVWAGDYEVDGNGDCGFGPPVGANLESGGDPFLPTVDFNGAIVVCIRGTYARVDKAEQVKENGAGGFVLINDQASGDSLIADPYTIPGVHLTYEDGQELLAWLESAPDRNADPVPEDYSRQAAIQGTAAEEDPANGDVMASFSSRGPNAPVPDVIKPDITAPGVDIFAAWMGDDPGENYSIISGTSMSSPHNAGSAALIRALHPDWSPDQVKSALMMTSFNYVPNQDGIHGLEAHDVLKENGETSADPFDFGAGRVDLSRAGNAGLVMEETVANYEAADPSLDTPGVPSTLNIPSLGNAECAVSCSWRRTVQGTTEGDVPWNVSVVEPAGVTITVEPATFTVAAGETQELTITASVTDATPFQWHFGQVVLSPGDLGAAQVDPNSVMALHMPLAVFVPPAPLGAPELDDPVEPAGCEYDLTWSDLAADEELGIGDEIGYRIQQSTDYAVGLEDNADNLAAYWESEGVLIVEGESVETEGWTESELRSNSPPTSYWSGNAPGGPVAPTNYYTASLTLLEPIAVPEGASPVITFASYEDLEPNFDYGYVQASNDGGSTWETALVVTGTRGEDEGFIPRTAEFSGMDGDVLVRFLYVADPLVGLAEGFEGWYVDDIVVSAGSWTDIGETAADETTFTVVNNPTGTYFHRVAGLVESGPGIFAVGPWSNVQDVNVECELAPVEPTPTPTVAPPAPESPSAPESPGGAASPTPRIRFIPNTAFDWGPASLATATSLVILVASLATVAVPSVLNGRSRRRK